MLHWPDYSAHGPQPINHESSNKRSSIGRQHLAHKRSISRVIPRVHKPLKNMQEIRLFELSPGDESAEIHGTLHHKALNETGPFEALSYTWTLAFKSSTLKTPDGDLPITPALEAALRRIRRTTTPRLLWIDAICIDQENFHEKASQIRMLKSIFRSAETVVAWLGKDHMNSHSAIEALLQIRAAELGPDQWPHGLPTVPESWHDGYPLPNDSIWEDIDALFKRRWFKRVSGFSIS